MANLQAHVAVQGNRVKQYPGGKVYLADGTEFELELFNGEDQTYGVEILMNGRHIGNHLSKLIIRPGARLFLDRFLDEAKKFRFETYDVEDSSEAAKAVRNNGKLEIRFYKERQAYPNYSNSGTWTSYTTHTWPENSTITIHQPDWGIAGSSTGVFYNGLSTTTNTSAGNISYTSAVTPSSFSANVAGLRGGPTAPKIETGRVEKGSDSDQEFRTLDMNFETYASSTINLQIKPESAKPIEVSDVRTYCTDCGRRLKKGWKYCAGCGNKA